MKKLVAILLAIFTILPLVACNTATVDGGSYVDPYKDIENYDEKSQKIYDDILGDFYTAYQAAKEAKNLSERFALMAIAEAKLLESGVLLPSTANGGNYAISRVAPYTSTSVLWGNDSYRYHNVVVADKPITTEHRDEMKAHWAEVKGQGTYEAWAIQYLKDKGYTIKDTYSLGYSTDPQTWDALGTSLAADSEAIVNLYDGLYEYDTENQLKPALATSYEKKVNDDGTVTYTFKIRENVKWVDSQGREVGLVKADDFVAGMQHMMDAAAGLEYLVQGLIVNADEYIKGTVTDFAQVGVKAVDDRTLEYTLLHDATYFMTMLGYGVFAPMSREFYESQGGKFGADFDSKAESYNYGKTPENIAYCGPYTVTSNTAKNTIVFSANENYWNKDNITIKTITWLFNDGEDALKSYNDMKSGILDGCGLTPSALVKAREEGLFDTNAYVSTPDATAFCTFYNINRGAFANFNDTTKVVSPQTPAEANRTMAAMRNQNFRLALSFALDRGNYNAQTVGDDLKYTSLINSYTPGTFVTLEEETTVKINGTDKTYPAGTYYGQIIQDQLDADGVPIKAWDPTADGGVGSSAGFDGWYSVENAKKYMEKAIKELEALGVKVSKNAPIQVDLPYNASNPSYSSRAQAYKKCFEDAFEGKVVLNLVVCNDSSEWYYAGYYPETGVDSNYDICDISGWGPDYGDPSSYLDTMLPEYAGYMTKTLGIF